MEYVLTLSLFFIYFPRLLFLYMSNFIKDAQGELEHVVWPTNNETKRYMAYTVGTIIIMATILAVIGFGFQQSLRSVRALFPHDAIPNIVSGEATTSDDANQLIESLQKKQTESQSGSINTLPTNSGEAQ